MIYECEYCETALGPGLLSCPNCGEDFDEPVPDDALLHEAILPFVGDLPLVDDQPLPTAVDRPQFALPRRRKQLSRLLALLLGVCFLAGLGWLGRRAFLPPKAPSSAALPSALLTEMTMHPAYAADMTAFVDKLHASGVGAQWPAFGGSDTLIIIPPTQVKGQPAAWNATLYRQLAQGIYAGFWEKRYESGFSDSDSTTCFVFVCDESGKVTAVDMMGTVE